MRKDTTLGSLIAVLLLFGGATTVQADAGGGSTTSEEATDSESEGSDRNWKLSGGITTSVGQGTFVGLENESNVSAPTAPNGTAFDRVNLLYRFRPSYKVDDFTFGARVALTHWLTQGGGLNEPGEIRFDDTALSTKWSGYNFDSIDTRLTSQAQLVLPTSQQSQTASRLAVTHLDVRFTKPFFDSRLNLTLGVRGTKFFHRYKSPRVNVDRVGEDNVLFRQGGAEDLGRGLVSVGGLNPSWGIQPALISQFSITEDLSANLTYAMAKYVTYRVGEDDDFRAEYAKKRGQSDISVGSFSLTYNFNKYIGASAALVTEQPIKTADNKGFRFPFWNTQGAANNFSSIDLSVTATY